MTATIHPPKVGDDITFAEIPDRTYRIAHIVDSDTGANGWGYRTRVESIGESWPTTLWQGDYGTPTGWEYAR